MSRPMVATVMNRPPDGLSTYIAATLFHRDGSIPLGQVGHPPRNLDCLRTRKGKELSATAQNELVRLPCADVYWTARERCDAILSVDS